MYIDRDLIRMQKTNKNLISIILTYKFESNWFKFDLIIDRNSIRFSIVIKFSIKNRFAFFSIVRRHDISRHFFFVTINVDKNHLKILFWIRRFMKKNFFKKISVRHWIFNDDCFCICFCFEKFLDEFCAKLCSVKYTRMTSLWNMITIKM